MAPRFVASIVLFASVLGSTGCGSSGPQRASVSGTVLLDGQPFEEGSINFIPLDGAGPTAGAPISNGEYRIERNVGVMVGKNKVEVRGNRKTGKQVSRMGSLVDELVEAVPPEYNTSSTLVRDVVPGHNALDFEVPSTRPRKP